MPPPGPSFIRLADELAGETGQKVRICNVKSERRLMEESPHLRAICAYSLYERNWAMNIIHNSRPIPCAFIPGGRWGDRLENPPGPRNRSKVMIISKIPSGDEIRYGLNLVGEEGRVLRECFAKHGVTAVDDWYITHLIKFPNPRPAEGGGLKASWVKDCRALLWQEIRLVRPDYVLCLGAEPAKELLGKFGSLAMSANKVHDLRTIISNEDRYSTCVGCGGAGITGPDGVGWPVTCPKCEGEGYRLRGGKTANSDEMIICSKCQCRKFVYGGNIKQAIPCTLCSSFGVIHEPYEYHNFKVMTCIHPYRVMLSLDDYPQLDSQIRLFCNLINSGGTNIEEQGLDYHIVDNEEELEREVDQIVARTPTGSIMAVDAEWHGDHPWDEGAYLRTVQISDRAKYALCVVLAGQGGGTVFRGKDGTFDIKHALPQLQRLLKSTPERKVRIAGQFFRSDMPQIKWHIGIDLMDEYDAPNGDEDDAPYRMKYEGGFDTGLAAHAVREADEYKLEVLASRYTSMARWDGKLLRWKQKYCAEHNIKADAMEGYGDCPGDVHDREKDVLYWYGCCDVDGTRRLVDVFNGVGDQPGLLDCDEYGLCSRKSFWVAMRASRAAAEMEATGLMVDMNRASEMVDTYARRRDTLLNDLRKRIKWQSFNIDSPNHVRELLFGVGMSGALDKKTGLRGRRQSPAEAIPVLNERLEPVFDEDGNQVMDGPAVLCNLMPIKATGKEDKKSWKDLVSSGVAQDRAPSTDKESLGILSAQSDIARTIRDIRFLGQLLKTTLRRPKVITTKEKIRVLVDYQPPDKRVTCAACNGVEGHKEFCKECWGDGYIYVTPPPVKKFKLKTITHDDQALDDYGNPIYDKGLLAYVSSYDGCIHTTLYQTLETGRWASARPNLMNISKRREDDYKQILGWKDHKGDIKARYPHLPLEYKHTLRSIFVAGPGEVLIEADYKAAELCCMAWMSRDVLLMEHVRRAQLPENHPDYYDIHANIAVRAFRLTVPTLAAAQALGLNVGDPCPPTKDALKECGYSGLRVAAKNVVFGFAYGRGAEAIYRQCKEEGVVVTVETCQGLIDGLKNMYPQLVDYFERCKGRPHVPGWSCSAGGYYRRIPKTERRFERDRKLTGDIQRQFMNHGIQNLVAYAASRACDYLIQYRQVHPEVKYKLALQIHDAFILRVPYEWAEHVYDHVLPLCMCKMVPIWSCDLNGMVLPDATEPHYLDVDREVMLRWSEKIYDDDPLADKVPARFVHKRKK